MKKTVYDLSSKGLDVHCRMALVSDLHSGNPKKVIELLKTEKPDCILLCGDILESLDGSDDKKNARAFGIFSACAELAPTFYCTGNHEDGARHSQFKSKSRLRSGKRYYTPENLQKIKSSGVHFLFDSYILKDGIAFGGIASGCVFEDERPNVAFLSDFASADAPKVLICHHPEYYERYIKNLPIDIIVSGHAHGGQWRIFGRGVYAPGQGLFPKYTSGVYEDRLVVSRGLKRGFPIPRFFNSREIVIIEL